jgi:alpha-L-arabinofuranosidase
VDEMILKVVNLRDKLQNAEIEIKGYSAEKIKVYQMYGWDLDAKNDFDNPMLVSPKESTYDINDDHFSFEFQGESITVFRMKMKRTSK